MLSTKLSTISRMKFWATAAALVKRCGAVCGIFLCLTATVYAVEPPIDRKFVAYGGADFSIDTELRGRIVEIDGSDLFISPDPNYHSLCIDGNWKVPVSGEDGYDPAVSANTPVMKLETYTVGGRTGADAGGPPTVVDRGQARPIQVGDHVVVSGLYVIDYAHPMTWGNYTNSTTYMKGFARIGYAHSELHPYNFYSVRIINDPSVRHPSSISFTPSVIEDHTETHTIVSPVYSQVYQQNWFWNKFCGLAYNMVGASRQDSQTVNFLFSQPLKPAGPYQINFWVSDEIRRGEGTAALSNTYDPFTDWTTETATVTGSNIRNPMIYRGTFHSALLAVGQGAIDLVNARTVAGWAFDPTLPNSPVQLDVLCDDVLIGTINANEPRPDVLKAGIGNGRNGYSLQIPATWSDGKRHHISVIWASTYADTNLNLRSSGTPTTFLCSATATGLTSSANPSLIGKGVTFKATVTGVGGTPSGTVQFAIDANNVGPPTALSGSTATFTAPSLSAGRHAVTATYSGDAVCSGSKAAPLTQVVNLTPASTALTSSRNPSSTGQPVTFTATVTGPGGPPTGTVQFAVDGGSVGSPVALSSGQAAFSTGKLSAGRHTVTAAYGGNAQFAASTSAPLTQTVNGTTVAVWHGDFETGDLSQWAGVQAEVDPAQRRIGVVTSPVIQGKHAARFLVRQGDDPIGSHNDRAELVGPTFRPGEEVFCHWSTLFDPTYPIRPIQHDWQVFCQFHQQSDSGFGSPPVEFDVRGDQVLFIVNPPKVGANPQGAERVLFAAPLNRGAWHDFQLHVLWHPDPLVGFVELYYNGRLVVPKTYCQTMFDQSVYLKLGLYRNRVIDQDGLLWHDGMVVGPTFASVRY